MSIGDFPTHRWDGGERRHGREDDYSGPERRRRGVGEADLHALHVIRRFEAIEDRLDRGSERMKALELELQANTATTREVRELMELGRNGFKVLGWLGGAAKWLGGLAAAGGAIWTAFYMATHGGKPPGG
jgi:hypothetical protein